MLCPFGEGSVASLARPGGNVTGLTTIGPELVGKQLRIDTSVPQQARDLR